MSFAINKKFSRTRCRTNSQINMRSELNRTIRSTSSAPLSMMNNIWEKDIPMMKNSFIDSFEHRITSTLFQRIPIIIKTLANICQILDDYPLSELKIDEIHQGTIDCILWNEDQSYPIAIDQNNSLNELRQSIREFIHEFLEFSQQILIISDENNQINQMIQKSIKYLIILNDYRIKRQSAYIYFHENSTLEDAMLILNNIDKQQFHELRLIALYLRQFFLKLITFIIPKFSYLK